MDYHRFLPTPATNSELFEYNELLGKVISSHPQEKKILASLTLSRIECQTGFFDKVYKFIKLIEIIEQSDENLTIDHLDFIVFQALCSYAQQQNLKICYSFWELVYQKLMRSPLRFWLKLLLLTSYELILTFLCKIFFSLPDKTNYDYALISFFDHRSQSQEGAYKDPYFQPLLEHFQKNKNGSFFIVVHLLNKIRLWQTVADLFSIRRMNKTLKILPSQLFLSCQDIIRIFLLSCIGRLRLKSPMIYQGQNIVTMINQSIQEDLLLRNNWFFAYKNYQLAEQIYKIESLKRVIYPYENHPWEKMFVLQRNEKKNSIKLIGFQHTSFSLKNLQYFPALSESSIPIYPDKIITAGQILKQTLDQYGHYPKEVIEDGCALRHSYLFSPHRPFKNQRTKKVAMVFSSDPTTYSSLFENLTLAFSGFPVTLYLKTHPLLILQEKSLFPEKLPNNFILAGSMSWDQIFSQIDLLLYHDNSVGIEAFHYGIDSYYFGMSGEAYNGDRLFQYYDTKIESEQHSVPLSQLSRFLENHYSSDNSLHTTEFSHYKHQYLEEYFSPITPEKMEKFLCQ